MRFSLCCINLPDMKAPLFRKLVILCLFACCALPLRAQYPYMLSFFALSGGALAEELGYEYRISSFSHQPAQLHTITSVWTKEQDKLEVGLSVTMGSADMREHSLRERFEIVTYYQSLLIRPVAKASDFLRFSFPTHLGFGFASARGPGVRATAPATSYFFLADMGVNVNVPLWRTLSLGVGAGYRQTFGVKMYGADNRGMSAPFFSFSIAWKKGMAKWLGSLEE